MLVPIHLGDVIGLPTGRRVRSTPNRTTPEDLMTTPITEFLLARIAEDEAIAAAAQIFTENVDASEPLHATSHTEYATYMQRWSPERSLAECKTKRRIVEAAVQLERAGRDEAEAPDWLPDEERPGTRSGARSALDHALYLLALPYAVHPDFDDSWHV